MSTGITIEAPAKLNLGLEVIGRRPDGYHEIATVFQAVSLRDRLSLAPDSGISVACTEPDLVDGANLVQTALELLRAETGSRTGARVTLTKRIPVAAGLGGASSDAAAALVAARALWQAPVSNEVLHQIGRRLGSDIPFFFHSGTALGTGRGDALTPLAPLTGIWFVVVSPRLRIPRKTPTLYAALRPEDFSDGSAVHRFAAAVNAGTGASAALPPNAFARPLYALHPELSSLPETMAAAGAEDVRLSGAGPSHFARFTDPDLAATVAARLRAGLAAAAEVCLVTPWGEPPTPATTYHG